MTDTISPPARAWAHAGVILIGALFIGLVDASMVRLGLLGAAGAYKYIPGRIWFVTPLCWLFFVALAALVGLVITRKYPSQIAVGMGLWFLAAEHASQTTRVVFIAAAVLTPFLLFALFRSTRGLMDRRWKGVTLAALGIYVGLVVGTVALTGPDLRSSSVRREASKGPNVLVVFLDTVRYDAVFDSKANLYPHLTTLRRLASESKVYDRAYAAGPWTLPSHLSALTGLEAHELGVDFDQQTYAGTVPTIAQKFRRQGYQTLAVTSNPYMSAVGRDLGDFDRWEQSQNALDVCRTAPVRYLQKKLRPVAMGVCMWGAAEVTSRAISQVRAGGAPYFMLLNYMDAHSPYDVSRECGGKLDGLHFNWRVKGFRKRYADDYARAVSCLDRKLAPLLDAAAQDPRGTIIVVTSDHGEQFGEHGLIIHANSLYPQLLHVPLLIRWPDRRASRETGVMSLADLPAILEGRPPRTPGTAMATLVYPRITERRGKWSAIRGDWQMISSARGPEELFNLRTDPMAEKNRISEPQTAAIAAELRQVIDGMKRETLKPRETSFRSLGYFR